MRPLTTLAALTAALLAAGGALAQPQGGGDQGQGGPPGGGNPAFAAMRQACAADMQKYCSDVQPGQRGARFQCMQAHQNDFSDQCKAAMAQARASRPQGGQGGPPQGGQ